MLAPQATAMRWAAQVRREMRERERGIAGCVIPEIESGVARPTIIRSYLSNQFSHLESKPSLAGGSRLSFKRGASTKNG